MLAESGQPQVLLLAIDADGHETDSLSTLRGSYDGYREAAESLGRLPCVRRAGAAGGAGGYQPETHKPQVWAAIVAGLCGTYVGIYVRAAVRFWFF